MTAIRKGLAAIVIGSLLSATTSCGYFLYPERVGQTEGKIDPSVVILDALGLLVGIIPGVVAFAVDLTTGTIYLPPGGQSTIEKHTGRGNSIEYLTLQPIPETEVPLDSEQTARQLSQALGIPIDPEAIEFYQPENVQARLTLTAIN